MKFNKIINHRNSYNWYIYNFILENNLKDIPKKQLVIFLNKNNLKGIKGQDWNYEMIKHWSQKYMNKDCKKYVGIK